VVGQLVQRLQLAPEGLKRRLEVAVAQRLVVDVLQGRGDQHPGRLGRLLPHQALGLLAVPEEAPRDQHEDAQPEDEAALPLQAGLPEQMLEAAIRHESLSLDWTLESDASWVGGETH